jgi:hypothetical protein
MECERCACCDCHARETRLDATTCPLCLWNDAGTRYSLAQARENVARYGVSYAPHDPHFAIVRHPILGPGGEYAIDRVALRGRAYIEFRAFGRGKPDRALLTERLQSLLQIIAAADRLYTK